MTITRARAATLAVFVAWAFLSVGDAIRLGYYSRSGIALVSAGFVVLVVVVACGGRLAAPSQLDLAVPLFVALESAILHGVNAYMFLGDRVDLAVRLLVIALIGIAACAVIWVGPKARRVTMTLAAGLTVVIAVLVIENASPPIDVHYVLQQSSSGLLHGRNMYHQRWVGSPGLTDVYPYFPGTTLLVAPFKWLFGDIRYALALASLVAVYVVYRLAPETSPALALLLVIAPHWAFLIDQSWTEPLLIVALAGAILAMRSERHGWAIACLAIAIATKQHILLLLPLFALWPGFGLRRTVKAALIGLAIMLPWIVAGPSAFWHDAIHAELTLPLQLGGLDLPTVLALHGVTPGFWLLALLAGGAYALVLWRLPRTPSTLALGCALVLYAVALAAKQSHFNHYALPLSLLVVAVAAAPPQPADTSGTLQNEPLSVET